MRLPHGLRRRPWLAAWLCFVPLVLLRAGSIAEGDTFWQIRTGQLELQRWSLMRADEYSWTAAGRPWVQNSWLFNVVDGAVYRLGGLPAVAVMGAVLALAVCGLVLALARVGGAAPTAAAAALTLYLPLLVVAFNVRPQLVDYLAFAAVLLIAQRLWDGHSPGTAVAVLFALCVLWANLHPATPTVIALFTALTLVAALRRERARTLAFATAAAAVALATGLNPYGYRVIAQGLSLSREASRYVFEWRHADPTDPWQVVFVIAAVAAAWQYRRCGQWVMLTATLVTLGFYLLAARYLPWVIIAASPGLALAGSQGAIARFLERRRPVLVAGVAALAAVAAPALTHLGRPDPGQYSTAVVAALPRDCRLYNMDTVGGIVTLLRPDVLVAADGRVEVYGAEQLYAVRETSWGDGDYRAQARDADCAIAATGSVLAAQLAADPQWSHLATDGSMVSFARVARD